MAFGDHRPIDSFYHLANRKLDGLGCRGLGCFLARHLDPARWAANEAESPPIYCLGRCFAAPARMNGELPWPRVVVDAPRAVVLERLLEGGAPRLADFVRCEGDQARRRGLAMGPEAILAAVEASELRGRGGAGFPAGRKWRAVANATAAEKFVVANADEGDPGAYIDRFLVEEDPHNLLAGMALAAHAVGARRGWIYLRKEYPRAADVLRAALAEARREGFLGERILGSEFSFDVELFIGQGSYLCGEETALLNSIEGRRPEVRSRPPYPTEKGLFGLPTLVNNVETFANVPWIVRHGAEAYRALGFSRSRGTKVVSLSSLFQRPGLYEVEFGVTLRHIVEDLGGGLRTGHLRALWIGAPLTGLVPPERLDTRLGFEELREIGAAVGHGGILAVDEHTSIPELVHHVFRFGADESCGKCTPCREGTARAAGLFSRCLAGRPASPAERREVADVVTALRQASLCGHGAGLAEFMASVERHYGKELEPCFA